MSLSSHLSELRKKHEKLSRQIEEEEKSLGVDSIQISQLKRQKLRIKEEITRHAAHG